MATIKRVGVIGAGQMGSGIAHVCALAGYDVLINDVARERIDDGLEVIDHNMSRQVARGIVGEIDKREAFARITPAERLADIGDVDLAIEAATENEETKKAIFKALQPHLSPTTLLASNTSSISITRLASATDRPEHFIGLHFMNPVPVMKLVEIIRGIATDADTYETAVGFAKSLGKTTANAEDFPAFIVNRILVPMINEAIYTLYEGVGTVDAIDTAMRLGANHPMGPLELGDFIGLDTVLSIMNVLYDGLADSKYRPCPLLVKYVEAGWLGPQIRSRLLRLPRRETGPDPLAPRLTAPPRSQAGATNGDMVNRSTRGAPCADTFASRDSPTRLHAQADRGAAFGRLHLHRPDRRRARLARRRRRGRGLGGADRLARPLLRRPGHWSPACSQATPARRRRSTPSARRI